MAANVGAKKRSGVVLIVVGVLLVISAIPGVAGANADGFGLGRVILVALAVLVVLVGIRLMRSKGHFTEPPA